MPAPETPLYNYNAAIQWVETKGKEIYGPKFTIIEQDRPLIQKLLVHILKDEVASRQVGIDLEKGILLTGPIGVGKTSLMNTIRFLQKPTNRHIIKSCRDVSFEFIKEGYLVIDRYSHKSYVPNKGNPITYCFDDLGSEQNLKYFGNNCNIMAEILLSRYDLFISKNLQTHITTNLSALEIEDYYGNRLRSRMREMFNLVAFEKNADDKRQ